MERELYALWQGLVGHERLIKGFKCYCYIDHKNNIFSDAQLDNRRRSKKMSNWALELQQFNIERIWIRGEANILADAPSRAPWEEKLAQFLPIPDMPVRELIIKLYQAPEEVDDLVSRRRQVLTGEQPWMALTREPTPRSPFLDRARQGELPTWGIYPGVRRTGGLDPRDLCVSGKRRGAGEVWSRVAAIPNVLFAGADDGRGTSGG
jgi:hypothetical protein